jgi:hypothetical protein
MKYFAEFYRAPLKSYPQRNPETGRYEVMPNPDPELPVPVCGTNGHLILDGRKSKYSHMSQARAVAEANGWVAYQIVKGETFTRNTQAVTPVMYI